MVDRLFQKYPGQIRLVLYHMPWSPKSSRAAEASLCAGQEGKFWEYHELLFDYQEQWPGTPHPEEYFIGYAKLLGLDQQKFRTCLDSQEMRDKVSQDKSYGKSININTTPTIFVNDTRIVGDEPIEKYERAIEQELRRSG